jgi:ribosomal protein S18 acetylase RimI-like enzyme
VTITSAQPEDIPDLASLRGGGQALEETMLGYLLGSYSPSFAQATRAVFVARLDNDFAGYCAGHRTTRYECDGELQSMNVAERYRGKGVADALIATLFGWFTAESIHRVCVNLAPENAAAQKFYRRHGAAELNPFWLVWPDIRLTQCQASVEKH